MIHFPLTAPPPNSPWPAPKLGGHSFSLCLGARINLSRFHAKAQELAGSIEAELNDSLIEPGPRAIFWTRMAGHLIEAGHGSSDKTAKLEDQASRLFPHWGPHQWQVFRRTCSLMRAEHHPHATPTSPTWENDLIFLRLAKDVDFSSLPEPQALLLARICVSMSARSITGFSSHLASRGYVWTPERFSASIIHSCQDPWILTIEAHSRRDPVSEDIMATLTLLTSPPTALEVFHAWRSLRPALAQSLLEAGAILPTHVNPSLALHSLWSHEHASLARRYKPARDAVLAHATSAWERACLAEASQAATPDHAARTAPRL